MLPRKPDPANRRAPLCSTHHPPNYHLPGPETSRAHGANSVHTQRVSGSLPAKGGLFLPLNLTPRWNHRCCPQVEGVPLEPVPSSRWLAGVQHWSSLQEKHRRLSPRQRAALQGRSYHNRLGCSVGQKETHEDASEGSWPLPDLPACRGCVCATGDSSSLSDESLLPLSEAWLFKVLPTAFSGNPALAAWLRLGTCPGCSVNLLTKKKHKPRNVVLVQVLFRSLNAVSAQAGFCFTLTQLLLTLTLSLACQD